MLVLGRPDSVAQVGRIDCPVQQDFRQNDGIQAPVSSGTGGIRIRSRIPGPKACLQGVQNLLHIHPPLCGYGALPRGLCLLRATA